MQSVMNRGLAGRERKAHYRNRAGRLFTQMLIDEYLEPTPDEADRDRFIPIRGRSDFLPAVATSVLEELSHADTQLELPLTCEDDNGRHKTQDPAKSKRNGNGKSDAVIRFRSQASRIAEETSEQSQPAESVPSTSDEKSEFTLRGFLYGCALGSGAAAVLLMGLWLIL